MINPYSVHVVIKFVFLKQILAVKTIDLGVVVKGYPKSLNFIKT